MASFRLAHGRSSRQRLEPQAEAKPWLAKSVDGSSLIPFRLRLVHLLDLGVRHFLAGLKLGLVLLAGHLVLLGVDLHLLIVLLAFTAGALLLRRSDRLGLG